MWEDLQNNAVSGIEVLRELGREKKENVMIPIVYTSTLGVSDSDNSFLSRSNISYKISQTPQVWIDCQIAEENGGVAVNWDYRTGVFLQNVIRDMFEAFERVLKRLGKKDNTVLKETDPIGLPEKTQAVRNKVNATERELPESLMAEGFVKSCVLYPNKTALITKDGEYTYAALKQYVSAVQHTLLENGLKPGDSAAVMLPKGIWQIAGVLGTLLAGGVYLPIDSKQPLQRRNDIIQDSGVKFVLTEKVEELYNQEKLTTINVNILDATTEYQLREIAGVRGSDPAYIIYTSGTTGKPKGVVISHEAAMNTIYDVIERFSLNRETVILGLSNLAFDLSVFDIFGCFQVGGTLVLPDDELKKNPKHILDLIIINRVTVLNAVPAQMKMLDSYMDNAGILEISWVKLIIMSGDWIPVGLPENLFKKFTNAIVVSMGGATECAIWSIFHIIPRGYEKKNSIPYGKPLSNQKFYILNAGMEDCPDGVSGDIYIAGKGLAKEYFKDKEMTDQKFIFLPRIGERIYKTGDVGQYDEAGIIEFLGRSDNQVKVRGHRIELTEIDSILSENKELDDVVSIIVGDAQEDRRIVTVAVPKQAEVATEDTSQEIQSKIIEQTDDFIVIDYGCRGHGIITNYFLFDGIQLCFLDFDTSESMPSQKFNPDIIQITHCQEGRYECEFANHTVSYLPEGYFGVAGTRYLPVSFSFPLKRCFAVSLVIDKQMLSTSTRKMMAEIPINLDKIGETLGVEKKWYIEQPSSSLQHLFTEIYEAKGCRHVGYFKIKAIELLYYMEQLTQINSCDFKYFDKRQIEATKAIRDYLIGHLDEKISLECLAKEAHLNLTVFHNIFFHIYGDTPYAYLKKYKMNLAAKLLLDGKRKIGDIALELGYNNASKFTKAFQSVYGVLPKDYRKNK